MNYFKSTDDLVNNPEIPNISRTHSEITIPELECSNRDIKYNNVNQQIVINDNNIEKPRDETFLERICNTSREIDDSTNTSNSEAFIKAFGFIIGSLIWIGVLFFTIAVPFLMTILALVHIADCPHQPNIPIVFFIVGISMSLSNIINTADKYSPPKQSSYRKRKYIVGALNAFINCFSIACFIAASIWVYGGGTPSFNTKSRDYCNPTLYEFAFWLLNLSFIFIVFLLIVGVIGFLMNHFFRK